MRARLSFVNHSGSHRQLIRVIRVIRGQSLHYWKVTLLSVLVEAWLGLPAISLAAPPGRFTTTVPVPVMPVTEMVWVVPLPVTMATSVPPTVEPVKDTSPALNPITASLRAGH